MFGETLSARATDGEIMESLGEGPHVSGLDIITFQKGLDRGRSPAMCDDVAKLACHGQGHCHTVSSTMAAFLNPFCQAGA